MRGFPSRERTGRERSIAAWGSVKFASTLVALKAVTYFFTGSAGVLGSALDSILDAAASLLVLVAVAAAERPADADHAWGHGKAESLASLFQSLLILVSGLGLVYETVRRVLAGSAAVEQPWLGVAVMVACALGTLWWTRKLRRAARATASPALESDTLHYASDVLLNGSVVAGLLLTRWLGTPLPDLLVGLGIALLILNTARQVFLKAFNNLMDRGLEPAEAAAVLRVVAGFAPRVSGFHDLRTRRSGRDIFLELHLDLDRSLSFVAAHELSEQVERAVEDAVPHSTVTVHPDPL
ncbi:MAG: cation transporter [Planctomycetota bacterium]|nr:MAG: cation transporter [Planctomycetota bacterium]